MTTFKQTHSPIDFQSYNRGANRDDDSELTSIEKGYYIDAYNMRPTEVNGHSEAINQIEGEELIYANIDNRCQNGTNLPIPGNYSCIGVRTVLNHIVEFWADEDQVRVPFVRVDGWVVLWPNSIADFPISVNFPLQMDKNDSCVGGEIYVTDDNIPPFFFNVSDLLQNSAVNPANNLRDNTYQCTAKYFSGFQLADYQIQLSPPLDHPVYIETVTAGTTSNVIGQVYQHGSGGLKVGGYQYAIRFTNTAGNITPFTEATTVIPVPLGIGTDSTTYPSIKTYGGGVGGVSTFGNHIRFRVTNVLNFDTLEVRRISFNVGAAFGVPGLDEIIAQIPITNGQISVIDFFDYDNTSIEAVTNAVAANTVSVIQAAKAIRYYNSRLFLFNIKYQSQDLTAPGNTVVFNQYHNSTLIPMVESLGVAGYRDVWNSANRKSYRRSEQYGMGLLGYNANAGTTFVLPIPVKSGLPNLTMPDRRSELGGSGLYPDSLLLSPTVLHNKLFTRAANNVGSGFVSQTFEIFDLVGAIAKSQQTEDINILNVASVPYGVFHPTRDTDGDTNEMNYDVCPAVWTDASGGGLSTYQPYAFAPNYYAMGVSFQGLKSYPIWMKAFSVVRTVPAGRVLVSGQSFYKMLWGSNTQKDTNSFLFDSPDLNAGVVPTSEITNNLSRYKVQLSSSLGWFGEVWSGKNNYVALVVDPFLGSVGIDQVNYCRILQDNGSINLSQSVFGINDTTSPFLTYVSFNSFRGQPNAANAPYMYGLGNFQAYSAGSAPRRGCFELDMSPSSPYSYGGTSGDLNYNDTNVQNWHEPVYGVNLYDSTQNVPNAFVQTYYETGAYIKIESIVGVSDGKTQQYYLVDERWEDCIPSINNYDPTATQPRFVYIKDPTGVVSTWLNVTWLTPAQIATINSAIAANGFYNVTQSNGNIVAITGMYTHGNINNRVFYLNFNVLDSSSALYLPTQSSQILVRYDNTATITVFGGDTYIGEYIYPISDANYGSGANPSGADTLVLDRPFMYPSYVLAPNYYVVNDTKGLLKTQQGESIWYNASATIGSQGQVRQMMVSGITESIINTGLDFGDVFPHVNYVVRPYQWADTGDCNSNDNKFNSVNNLYPTYLSTDYPGECSPSWGYGGFHMDVSYNRDYSAIPINTTHSSKPLAGFVEQLSFCTRGIWSEVRPINDVGAPGIQTFLPTNFFDLGDETGEIKYSWASTAARDSGNLYVFTEHGIARMLTENLLLNEVSGGGLAAIGSADDTEIQKAIWISKETGMNDQTWRTAAEWNNTIYWMNKNSAYKFDGNAITNENDIGNRKYKTIITGIIDDMQMEYGTDMTGYYDQLHDEYWLSSCQHVTRYGYLYDGSNPNAIIKAPHYVIWQNSGPITFTPGEIISVTGDQIAGIKLFGLTAPNFYICNAGITLPITVIATTTTSPTILTNVTIQPGQCYEFTNIGGNTYKAILQNPDTCVMPIYSEKTGGSWIGTYGYQFDRYTAIQNKSYGVRNIQTYLLNEGPTMNGAPLSSWVMGVSTGVPNGRSQGKSEGQMNVAESKEFIRVRIESQGTANAGVGTSLGIPQYINFYNSIEQFKNGQIQSVINLAAGGQYYLRDYGGGWENYIPRKLPTASVGPTNRVQGKALLFQIGNDTTLNTDWRITLTQVQSKNLV